MMQSLKIEAKLCGCLNLAFIGSRFQGDVMKLPLAPQADGQHTGIDL